MALTLAATPARAAPTGPGPRTLDDYRYFRSLSVDLSGRVPTRDELAAFERPDFDLGAWVEEKLRGPGYVDRLTRVYMDSLRLEINPLVVFTPPPATLFAETIKDEKGTLVRVFYRRGQRRVSDKVDGDFCISQAESGVDFTKPRPDPAALPRVPNATLEKATVKVKPWWLYRDYRAPEPRERIGEAWKSSRYFQPSKDLLFEPDGTTPVTAVRVCREEAHVAEQGTLWVSDRYGKKPPPPPPPRRPFDDWYAAEHRGEPVACNTQMGLAASIDCGCGPGLERCVPQLNDYGLSFVLPAREPVGLEGALNFGPGQISHYQRWWWREEATKIFGHVFGQDRDVRELVTGRYTYVNGPLSQFYRFVEPSACCQNERPLGMYFETDALFRPERVPNLLPHEVDVWTFVPDRGPHAAGILTSAAFLEKYASRRARAAAAYTALLCKNFVADTSSAPPSKEPNLMVRAGCASCHATLEPLAAYFSHVKEGSMTFLSLKTEDVNCKLQKDGKARGYCPVFYEEPFSSTTSGILKGAYASRENAEGGPLALGAALAASPDYLRCAVDQVASSFLGRPLTPDDEPLRATLQTKFAESGNRMRSLVRAIVLDSTYAKARLGPSREPLRPASPFVHPPIAEEGKTP